MSNVFARTHTFARFKAPLFAALGFFAAVGVLSVTHLGPAQAQSPGVNLAALVARLNADDTKLAADDVKLAADDAKLVADDTKIAALQAILPTPGPKGDTGAPGTNGAPGTPGTNGTNGAPGTKGDAGTTGAQGIQGIQGLQGIQGPAGASPFTVSGTDVTLTGYNLHIVNGLSSTGTLNGLGNLIVGYNALGNTLGAGDVRTGSHNLILGDLNNYSSFGGLVAGRDNAISGQYGSVSGGGLNAASGNYASVSGGNQNTANGDFASVSGGAFSTASGDYASVSGGSGLTQSNTYGWTGGTYQSP